MSNARKSLYLVDVSSMFFRAYYAVRPLSTSKGIPTNAIYGYLSMIVKLLKEIKPDYLAFCYDRPEPSFRKDIYPEYKANRSEMPEDLAPQIPYIKQLTEALGIPAFEMQGFEADDLIGTFAMMGEKHNLDVVIVSGDKDFSQLINEHTIMYDTMKDTRFTVEKVVEKWGVEPKYFIDYLALTGDSSDNIPGVRGVGPKGAQKLINEFHTIEEIYKRIDEVKNPTLKNKLLESQEMALLSKKLVTIETDVQVDIGIQDLKMRERKTAELEKLLEELEFQSFKKNLITLDQSQGAPTIDPIHEAPKEKKPTPTDFKVVHLKNEDFEKWLENHKNLWIVDSERSYIFASKNDVVVFEGDEESLARLFDATEGLQWSGYDLKTQWRKLGVRRAQTAVWDAMLAAYVVQAGPIESFGDIFIKYVGETLPDLPTPDNLYGAHLQLRIALLEKLEETRMTEILKTIELPIIDVLTAMEKNGVLIDVEFLNKESKTLAQDLKKIEEEIYQEAGETFNIASPKQLGQILFEKMNLPKGKKTKTGYSTNNEVLENLEEFPIAKKIIEYREIAKLKSTYVDALPTMVDPKTGRIHTQYNQALTATGRLSSVHPNLQNIPIRTERGMRIRRAFIANKGHILVAADYSQIELRILAHISNDKGLMEAFAQDLDIHTKTASEVFSVPLDQVTSDLRRKAKAVNFGIAYGQGAYGLADGLKIPRGEAKIIIDTYFERFNGVKKYMHDAVESVKKTGYSESLLGRRRYLPEINSKNFNVKAFAERAAINAPIQGMSSDIVKMAMIQVAEKFRDQMILQVHDELIFELPDDTTLEKNMQEIQSIMENCITLSVPLKVNIGSGKNWSEI